MTSQVATTMPSFVAPRVTKTQLVFMKWCSDLVAQDFPDMTNADFNDILTTIQKSPKNESPPDGGGPLLNLKYLIRNIFRNKI